VAVASDDSGTEIDIVLLMGSAMRELARARGIEQDCQAIEFHLGQLGFKRFRLVDGGIPGSGIALIYATDVKAWPQTADDAALAILASVGDPSDAPDSTRARAPLRLSEQGILTLPLIVDGVARAVLQLHGSRNRELTHAEHVVLLAIAEGLSFGIELEDIVKDREVGLNMAIQIERTALAGLASAGVAHRLGHEIRDVWRKAKELSKLEAVRQRRELNEFFEELLDRLDEWVKRARTPLTFAHPSSPNEDALASVNKAITRTTKMWYTRTRDRQRKLCVEPLSNDALVAIRPTWLVELLSCLVVNSIQANAREILLRARAGTFRIIEGEDPIPAVEILVADNGEGIPRDLQARIFMPDFSTKSSEHGSGMGLAIARAIAEMAGGLVKLTESRPYDRTSFVVLLPTVSKGGAEDG